MLTTVNILDVPVGRFFQHEGAVYLRVKNGVDNGTYGSGYHIFRAVNRHGCENHQFFFIIRGDEKIPVHLIAYDRDPFEPTGPL